MKVCILMASPRKTGNTAALLEPFMEELGQHHIEHNLIWLYDKRIEPCIACRVCQKNWTTFGCHYNDDAQEIFDKISPVMSLCWRRRSTRGIARRL